MENKDPEEKASRVVCDDAKYLACFSTDIVLPLISCLLVFILLSSLLSSLQLIILPGYRCLRHAKLVSAKIYLFKSCKSWVQGKNIHVQVQL